MYVWVPPQASRNGRNSLGERKLAGPFSFSRQPVIFVSRTNSWPSLTRNEPASSDRRNSWVCWSMSRMPLAPTTIGNLARNTPGAVSLKYCLGSVLARSLRFR
ncbi:hypothetical protein D3C78_1121680 [compost metagenome]